MSKRYTDYVIHLPRDWTPEQALAVHDLLAELAEAIWQHYEEPMIELLHSEYDQKEEQPDLFGFDPIPF